MMTTVTKADNEYIITPRLCWVDLELMFMLLIGYSIVSYVILFSILVGDKHIIDLLGTIFLDSGITKFNPFLIILGFLILPFIPKAYFYKEYIEISYPYRFWKNEREKLYWESLDEVKTMKPARERRIVLLKFKRKKLKFRCSEKEILILRDTIKLPLDFRPWWAKK